MTDTSPDLTPGDQPRRSYFLVAMAFFASFYLAAFGLDASFSAVEEVFRTATGSFALLYLRNEIAAVVVFATLPMIFVLIFVPYFPKRIFIPLILYIVWAAFGLYPYSLAYVYQVASYMAVALQFLLAFAAFYYLGKTTGHYFFAASRLPRKQKLLLRTVVATLLTAVTMPIAAVALLLFAIVTLFEGQTGGYLNFGLAGVDVQESIMTRGTQTVHLVAMVHIGDPQFYRDLVDEFPEEALVISEGVTDRQGLLSSDLSYARAAAALGLQQQPNFEFELTRRALESREENDQSPTELDEYGLPRRAEVKNADVDVSDFEDITIQFVSDISYLYNSQSPSDIFERGQEVFTDFTEDDYEKVMYDLVTLRNERAILELDASLSEYSTIILPWGALHMPGMEAELIARGFEPTEIKTRRIAQYSTILAQFLN